MRNHDFKFIKMEQNRFSRIRIKTAIERKGRLKTKLIEKRMESVKFNNCIGFFMANMCVHLFIYLTILIFFLYRWQFDLILIF